MLIAAALAMLPAISWSAGDPAVESFSLHVEGRVISASISITPHLPQAVIQRIRGGLPVVFTYRFTLRAYSPHWKDRKIDRAKVSVTVKYDPVRVEYQAVWRQDGELVDTRRYHHWEEAVTALTSLRRWEVFTVPDEAVKRMLYVEAWVHMLPRTRWLVIPDDIRTDEISSSHFTVYE